jgi:hypothetical protein
MFYLSWKSQLDILSDKELRRFINNLISWHHGEKIELKSKSDILIWTGILPALEINDEKWNARAETSRENGKKSSGRPPKPEITHQVIDKPTKPVNSKRLNVKSEKEIEKGELLTEESKLEIEKSQKLVANKEEVIDNTQLKIYREGQSISSYLKSCIDRIESELSSRYPQYPFLLTMANPTGIKELKNHIDKKEDLEIIFTQLKELSEIRFKLRGNYN